MSQSIVDSVTSVLRGCEIPERKLGELKEFLAKYERKNSKKLKIAFGATSRVGKDHACSYLAMINVGVAEKFAFSDDLYEVMYDVQTKLGIRHQKDREFLQFVGEWCRSIDPCVWVHRTINKINESEAEAIFVSDVRLDYEFERLRHEGFIMVKIVRPGSDLLLANETNNVKPITEEGLNHKTWDFTIVNDGTLEEFEHKLDDLSEWCHQRLDHL